VASEVSFEAAKCSFLGLAFGFFALEVGACDRGSSRARVIAIVCSARLS
jgi:hypothetical protein